MLETLDSPEPIPGHREHHYGLFYEEIAGRAKEFSFWQDDLKFIHIFRISEKCFRWKAWYSNSNIEISGKRSRTMFNWFKRQYPSAVMYNRYLITINEVDLAKMKFLATKIVTSD